MISRLDNLVESGTSTALESYTYLGLSTVVVRSDGDGIRLTYIGGGTGDAGDQYTGLDRFGRVLQQIWMNSGNTIVDGYGYTYDADGNVISKANALNSTFSENYSYDSLSRLINYTRNSTSNYQSFTLNAVGDITAITTGNVTQNRTVNSDNQITAISNGTSSALTLTYDNNGNLTTDDHGDTLIYDAWNRLIQVNGTSGSAIAVYNYDGMGRRITATEGGGTTDFYFSGQQDIEERQGGNVTSQTVFSPVYVNAPILRDTYSGGSFSSRVYFTADANANITGVFSVSGAADQYMVYDSGGNVAFKTSTWGTGSNSQNVTLLYQGMQFDSTIGWYFVGNSNQGRLYSPTMEVWNRPDTGGGYVNGPDLYAFETDNPINKVDPKGTDAVLHTGATWDPKDPNARPVYVLRKLEWNHSEESGYQKHFGIPIGELFFYNLAHMQFFYTFFANGYSMVGFPISESVTITSESRLFGSPAVMGKTTIHPLPPERDPVPYAGFVQDEYKAFFWGCAGYANYDQKLTITTPSGDKYSADWKLHINYDGTWTGDTKAFFVKDSP